MCRVKTDPRTHQDNFASQRKGITLILCFSASWQWASLVIKRRNVLLCQSEEPRQPARALWSLMCISGGLLGAGVESCPPCSSVHGNLICICTEEGKVGSLYHAKKSTKTYRVAITNV